MRHHLQHAALLLPAALAAATAAPAQLVHSPQVNLHRHHREDLSWLATYAQPTPNGSVAALAADPRFKSFLQQNLTAPQSFWAGGARPLPEVALDFLSGTPGRVLLDNLRYLTVTACVPSFCPNRGLLWVDLALDQPLVAFAAIDWITENRATESKDAAYTLWLFPNQPLDLTHLPGPLVRSLRRWTAEPAPGSANLQNITRVFLVDPDGTPHQLTPSDVGAHSSLPAETHTATDPKAKS